MLLPTSLITPSKDFNFTMSINRLWLLGLFLLGTPLLMKGQQPDTLRLGEFFELLRAGHPIARQADLLPREARAQIRMARGAFDPKLFGDVNQKVFKGDNYYRHLDGGLKIMTLPGVEIKAGYENYNGINLNPELTVPGDGLMYAGVAVPLGQGLLIDSRRAALQQAKIFQRSIEAEQLKMLNKLYYDAAKAYWEWSLAASLLRIQTEATQIAQRRFDAIKESFAYGDKPGVDTLEAFTQVLSRQQNLLEAELAYRQAKLGLSTFLWNEEGQPLEVTDQVVPVPVQIDRTGTYFLTDSAQIWLNQLSDIHPELQLLRFKLQELEVERRFKADKLKPQIYANYNLLNEPVLSGSDIGTLSPAIFSNNYKWGLTVNFPLFLRKERGNLELTRLKIQDTQYKQELKAVELTNKVRSYLQEVEALADQVDNARSAVRSYAGLLEAEIFKFEAGQSSLFLINSRETKLIEARIKLQELQMKLRKAVASLSWSAGVLANGN